MEKNKLNLKILICHYGLIDSGGFSRNYNFAKGLVDLGNNVVLLTTSNSKVYFRLPYKKIIRDGVEILVFFDFLPKIFLRGGFGIFSTIFKIFYSLFNRFDIVQSDSGQRPASGLPCLVNKFFHKSIYISEWWDFFGKGGHFDRKSFLKKLTVGIYDVAFEILSRKVANGVVCISEEMKKRALQIGINGERIIIINGGSDVNQIKFIESSSLKAKYGLNESVITFGFVGIEDDEINDFKDFLKCLSNPKFKNKIFCFTFGKKISQKFLLEFNLNNLHQLGWIDYKTESEKLSAVDFFVLLKEDNLISRHGWPNVLGDYLAAGRQIITNGVGDIMNYLRKYPDAFIYCKNELSEIENTILEVIKNYEKFIKNRKYCREVAEKELSWHKKSEELLSFYYKFLNNNS